MRRRQHNLASQPKAMKLALVLFLGLSLICRTSTANGFYMGFPEVSAVVLRVAILNKTMRDAAENPMDKWRRENVRRAISALPPAIVAMAGVFKSGKLHNGDLAPIQSMLGGFVDVSAGDRYKKFLNHPNAADIPQVGAGFPVISSSQLPASEVGPGVAKRDPNISTVGPEVAVEVDAPPADLASFAGGPEKNGKGSSDSIGFDDSAKQSAQTPAGALLEGVDAIASIGNLESGTASSSTAAVAVSTSSTSTASTGQGFTATTQAEGASTTLVEVQRDLASIEGEQKTEASAWAILKKRADGTDCAKGDKECQKAEDDFWKSNDQPCKKGDRECEEDARQAEGRPRARVTQTDPRNFKLNVKPKNWHLGAAITVVEAALIHKAAAEEEGGCEDCKKGGGGGGGGGGGDAAQILMGVAAIIAAIAPIIVAQTQAEADKAIAKINADTQVKLTEISSDTSKFLANEQKEIALTQSTLAQQTAFQQEQFKSDRLNSQLAELRSAREDAQAAEDEKRRIELEFNQQRLALAEQQRQDNIDLARETAKAQLTQAGLISGFANSRNSGDRLTTSATSGLTGTVTGTGSTGSVASTQLAGGDGSAASAGSVSGSLSNFDGGSSGSLGLGIGVPTGQSSLTTTTAQGETVTGGSVRLLKAATATNAGSKGFFAGADTDEDEEVVLDENGKPVKKKKKATVASRGAKSSSRGVVSVREEASRGIASSAVGQTLSNILLSNSVAAGSTSGKRNYISPGAAGGSDLNKFISASGSDARVSTPSFADFRESDSNSARGIRHSSGRGASAPGGHSPKPSTGRGIRSSH